MYRDILVATDGSDQSMTAATHGFKVAKSSEATVHGLYIVDSRIVLAAAEDSQSDIRGSLQSEGENALAQLETEATAAGLDVTTTIEEGTPWKEILDYTTSNNIDLIVVGSHGKSPREKVKSLGSVSERVVDNASAPVLVVREE
ncbi:universal stress protein [Salinarchaeum sp. IM2453]|uniref:universal stress protein n=1 Tax=Salinarchaeum sp. IM2453 TaxID=2862870 RepID=UPI001C82BFB6|nr:universal stress protein [Salinarchaeum sp. IM2453]QZA88860.1 universal stress protein [Salinarchaeum sp. IM2453]